MNLAQTYSEDYVYSPCAMARFADAAGFNFEQKCDLMGKYDRERPFIRVPLQLKMWRALCSAKKPLSMGEVYAHFSWAVTDNEKHSLRNQLAKWLGDGWLIAEGGATKRKYSIKGAVWTKL